MNGPIVMKFGGTSVADADRLRRVAALAEANRPAGVLLVLSALSKVTDGLFACGKLAVEGDEAGALARLDALVARHEEVARELFPDGAPEAVRAALELARREIGAVLRGAALLGVLPERSMDLLAGRGELLSTTLLAAFMGAPWVDARSVLRTDSRHGQARPQEPEIRRLAAGRLVPLIRPGLVAVTQGYIGSDERGVPTTLGRGGSDYSASLLGAAVDAAEIQIWTDVEGVLSCDPRVVPAARPVETLGYDEASELAAFGAKVLHPATILPAVARGIPVTVRNSLLPDGRFTTISRKAGSGLPVTALASRRPVTVVTVQTPRMLGGAGFLARIFEVFGRLEVPVDIVSTSEVSVSMTVNPDAPLEKLKAELAAFADVHAEEDRAIVALVGERLRKTRGVAGRAFTALGGVNIEMISQGANEINLSFVVEGKDAEDAMRALHAAFFDADAGTREGAA